MDVVQSAPWGIVSEKFCVKILEGAHAFWGIEALLFTEVPLV